MFFAYIKDFEANIFAFFVTIQPENHEIHLFGNCREMIGNWSALLVKLSHRGCIKEYYRIHTPILKVLREVAVEYMTSH